MSLIGFTCICFMCGFVHADTTNKLKPIASRNQLHTWRSHQPRPPPPPPPPPSSTPTPPPSRSSCSASPARPSQLRLTPPGTPGPLPFPPADSSGSIMALIWGSPSQNRLLLWDQLSRPVRQCHRRRPALRGLIYQQRRRVGRWWRRSGPLKRGGSICTLRPGKETGLLSRSCSFCFRSPRRGLPPASRENNWVWNWMNLAKLIKLIVLWINEGLRIINGMISWRSKGKLLLYV